MKNFQFMFLYFGFVARTMTRFCFEFKNWFFEVFKLKVTRISNLKVQNDKSKMAAKLIELHQKSVSKSFWVADSESDVRFRKSKIQGSQVLLDRIQNFVVFDFSVRFLKLKMAPKHDDVEC